MNVNLNNIGMGAAAFGGSREVEGGGIQAAKPAGQDPRTTDVRFSDGTAVDFLQNSEPVATVPAGELVRDDSLGKLVSAAFNLPPPPMPVFA